MTPSLATVLVACTPLCSGDGDTIAKLMNLWSKIVLVLALYGHRMDKKSFMIVNQSQ